jgi:hypothetical protein
LDFHKLKLQNFTSYNGLNIPQGFNPPLTFKEEAECYFMFVDSVQDVMTAINMILNKELPTNNRVFFVYKKGQKHFHRDHVYNIVIKQKGMKRKAPILASLDKEHSVFCFMLEV